MIPKSFILSRDDHVYVADSRISIEQHCIRDWNMHIINAKHEDQGVYYCVAGTKPLQIKRVRLILQGKVFYCIWKETSTKMYTPF